MKKILFIQLSLFLTRTIVGCCGTRNGADNLVPGHYTYEHGWEYAVKDAHMVVHETGTMDFYQDGTALDSAHQVYTIVRNDGTQHTVVFNYISPSRWKLVGEDFYFSGVKETFRMEVLETQTEDQQWVDQFAQSMIKAYASTIDHETAFHLDRLTRRALFWSLTYKDGHTDHWEFYKR